MARYKVKDEETGKTVTFDWEGDSDPTDEEMEELFSDAATFKSPAPEITSDKKGTLAESLFPSAVGAKGKMGKIAGGALDVLSLPTRAAAAAVTSQKMSDPGAYALKPVVERMKTRIDESLENQLPKPSFTMAAPGSFSVPPPTAKQSAEFTKPMLEIAGSAASDPLSWISALGKAGGKGISSLGKRIEAGVIGKGGKATGRLQNVKLPDVAENVLKNKLGGTAEQTLEKANKAMLGFDDEIQKVLSSHPAKESVDNLIDVGSVIDGIKNKISKDPNYAGSYKDIIGHLDNWKDALDNYNLSGVVSLEDAQKAKRAVGKSAFKTRGIPTPDLQAKELAADEIKMALADEIERVAPEIKAINDQYRELIPIKKLAQNRVWTDQAQYPITAGDLWATIAGATLGGASNIGQDEFDWKRLLTGIGTGMAYKGLKSGNVAQALYGVGKGTTGTLTSPVARALTAGSKTGALSTGIRSQEEEKKGGKR